MTTRTIRELLEGNELLSGLDPAHLDLVAGCGRNVTFAPGDWLGREGDPAESFFVLREGRVGLEVHAPHLGPIVIATLSPGDVLGWSWLFPPHRWRFDARAVETVRAVALDGVCLRGKLDADPRLGYELMRRFARVMVSRLEATRLQILDIYGRPS